MSMLATKQLDYDPTSKLESSVQQKMRKITENVYKSFTKQDLTLVNYMGMQKYTNFQLITQYQC